VTAFYEPCVVNGCKTPPQYRSGGAAYSRAGGSSHAKLRRHQPLLIEDAEQNLTPRMRSLLEQLWQEWKSLNQEVECVSDKIDAIAAEDAACQRLRQIPGVGPLVATATVAAIGNGSAFRKGREFAAWLGLIPRQHSTGGKARLLGISKRGSIYLRRMFIHGARAMLLRVKYDTGRLGQWAHELEKRVPRNKAVVAVANKPARITWAVLSSGNEYCNAAPAAA